MKPHKIGWLNVPGYIPQTWNPIVGCSKISEGCRNCYAERMALRLSAIAHSKYPYPIVPDSALEGWVAEDHLQILEEKALRNLRDVVRAEIRERDKKTGFFDEAKAWTNIRNALGVC